MTLIDKDLMEKHIMESKVFTRYFKELVQSLIWGEEAVDAVEVVHAEWNFDHMTGEHAHWTKCSVCGFPKFYKDSTEYHNYCPNCGAKMDGHKKEGVVK